MYEEGEESLQSIRGVKPSITLTVSRMTVRMMHRQFVFVAFTDGFLIQLIPTLHRTDQKLKKKKQTERKVDRYI